MVSVQRRMLSGHIRIVPSELALKIFWTREESKIHDSKMNKIMQKLFETLHAEIGAYHSNTFPCKIL